MNTTSRPAAEQTVINALGDHPDTTAAEIATTGELGRSTVSKILTKLESAGKVKRSPGGRDGARRLPRPLEPRRQPISQEPPGRQR